MKFIKFISDTQIIDIKNQSEELVKLKTNNGIFKCNLLVGADGRYSKTRELSNLNTIYSDYNQSISF